MGLFDNIPEPKEEDKYIWVWEELLPRWAYTDEEWKDMIRNPDNSCAYVKREIPKESGYYGR